MVKTSLLTSRSFQRSFPLCLVFHIMVRLLTLSCFATPLCCTYISMLLAYFPLVFFFLLHSCLVYLVLGYDTVTVVLESLFESVQVEGF